MTEPLEQMMARLRAEYLAEIPARLAELEHAVEAFARDEPGARVHLARLFHRLAGSAGAYGFGDVTRRCRQIEEALKLGLPVQAGDGLREGLEAMRRDFARGPTTPPIAP